jgi:hypothetical protein
MSLVVDGGVRQISVAAKKLAIASFMDRRNSSIHGSPPTVGRSKPPVPVISARQQVDFDYQDVSKGVRGKGTGNLRKMICLTIYAFSQILVAAFFLSKKSNNKNVLLSLNKKG